MGFEPDDILFEDELLTDSISGDLVVGASNVQHVEDILKANKGHFYQWPLIGANLIEKLNSPSSRDEIKQDIKLALTADDYRVKAVDLGSDGSVSVDAERLK